MRNIHSMIETIVKERGKGNPMLEKITLTKIIMLGINPNEWTPSSGYNADVASKLQTLAREFDIKIG